MPVISARRVSRVSASVRAGRDRGGPSVTSRQLTDTGTRRAPSPSYAWGARARKVPPGNVRCLRGHAGTPSSKRAASGRRGGANLREHRADPGTALGPRRDDARRAPADRGRPLRVALLSYRSKPHCGGQGIYLRHLSRELAALGHHVEVFSGQPYPELEPGPVLRTLPSLDLYREPDPFRTPRPGEYRDWIDVLEVASMWTGGVPRAADVQPARAARAARRAAATSTSCTTTRCWPTACSASPGSACRWSPASTTRSAWTGGSSWPRPGACPGCPSAAGTASSGCRAGWPAASARCSPARESSRDDICRDFRVARSSVHVIPLGVDTRLFHPRPGAPRARPDRGRGQRRLAREGHLDAAAGRGQAHHGTQRRADRGRQARSRRPDRAARRRAGARRPGPVRQRDQRHRARRVHRQRRDRGGALALRGVLAARGRAHGVGHPADRQPDRRAARGDRRRGAPGHARRRRGTGGGAADAARLGRRAGAAVRAWPCAGCRSASPGPRWPGPPSTSTARAIDAAAGAGRRQPPC